jgi:hypothetical protein
MFYGIYECSGAESFATVPQDDLLFPPGVLYKNRAYRLSRTFQVNTPHQKQEFEEYCTRNNIESDVNLSSI